MAKEYLDKTGLAYFWSKIKDNLLSTSQKGKIEYSNIAYATCTTAAATAAKVATISGNTNWELKNGSIVAVKFSYTNTAQNPTLNVNSTGAKSILYGTANITTSNLNRVYANRTVLFMYNGSVYVWLGWTVDDNTTYTNMTQSELTTGTATNARSISAKVLRDTFYAKTEFGDYIVETGGLQTDGQWYWEKWASGKAVCYIKNYSFGSTTFSSAYGSLYYVSKGSYNFPSGLFNDVPAVYPEVRGDVGIFSTNVHSKTKDSYSIYIGNARNITVSDLSMDLMAIGTWK